MAPETDFLKHVLTRRQLLRDGSAGIGALALNSLLAPEAFPTLEEPEFPTLEEPEFPTLIEELDDE